MSKKKKVTVNLIKNKKEFTYNQVRMYVSKIMMEKLELDDENNKIYFSFSDASHFTLSREKIKDDIHRTVEEREVKKNGANGHFFFLPSSFFGILRELKIYTNFETQEVFIDGERRIDYYMNQKSSTKKNVILFKVNKGGIGKTFLTCQIGHGLALLGKKVLIITSDSQNNVLNFLHVGEKKIEKGLQIAVSRGLDVKPISLRKNLDFIPLENNRLGIKFVERLSSWITKKREEYDYILIDSVPTMNIDSEFVKEADKIIIPAFCDEATIEGIVNLLEDIEIYKVFAIVVNRFKPRKIENKYLEFLRSQIAGTDIYLGEPIKDLSFISMMLDKKKSIWEYENVKSVEVQQILLPLLSKLIEEVEGGIAE